MRGEGQTGAAPKTEHGEAGARRRRRVRTPGPRFFLWPAMIAAAASSPPAAAAPPTPGGPSAGITADIRVGFGGYVVPDAWIPVTLRLRSERGGAGTVEVTASRARPPGTERVRVEGHLVPRPPPPLTVPVI